MKTNKISGNKGEWSEIYAFLKLLGEKRIYGADEQLRIKEDVYYDINKILREETKGQLKEYVINEDLGSVDVVYDGEVKIRFKAHRFEEEADYLFDQICSHEGSFTIDRTVEFMEKIECSKIKASPDKKADMLIEVHDFRTGMDPVLGFSIKSELGNSPTLLNAGKTTNFIFELSDANDSILKEINGISGSRSIIDRIRLMREYGIELKYAEMESRIFRNNLTIIDSELPGIIADMLRDFYLNGVSGIYDLISRIHERNPMKYDLSDDHPYYKYKVGKFLVDVATGMVPNVMWNGHEDATGGYFIVRQDGEIVCYHLYNRNDFEEYLLRNTFLDKASTSRHDYAKIIKRIDGTYIMKLNLQIRFSKVKQS